MNKKLIIGGIVGISILSLLAVTYKIAINQNWLKEDTLETDSVITEQTNQCSEAPVSLEGYTETGTRLGNCFVEYPGEPTREDDSYYVVEDICGQFTQEFIENMSGLKFIQIKEPIIQGLYNCSYFINTDDGLTGDYLLIQLEYLIADDQKIGHELLGRIVKEDSSIPMKNYIVYQEDGFINCILLVLSNNKYIRIDRSSILVSDETLKNTAINIAKEINGYK